ncbi:uncharacterized protein LOC134105297 [Pungitius pungitius]|uniref:uncharacterized protein LOC134105297 n=1 Tax=Pungitius pungitius TaxID=134920 RepID=UPI002E124699
MYHEDRETEGDWTVVRYGRRRGRHNEPPYPPDQRAPQQYQRQRPRYQRDSYADVAQRAPDRRGGPRLRNNGGQNNRYAERSADRGTRRGPPRPRSFAPRFQRPKYSNNNNRYFNNNQHNTFQSNEGARQFPRSDDPLFPNKCRILHRIIKAAHHFTNINLADPPITIARMTKQLATFIKPAIPTTDTQSLIDGNAKNWEHTTLVILQDHYEAVIKREIESLHSLNSPDWSAPFDVASAWARRDFGRRLHPETLVEAKEAVVDWMAVLLTEDPQPAPAVSAPTVTTTRSNSSLHPLRRVRPGDAAEPLSTTTTHNFEAQAPPEPQRPTTAVTRTIRAQVLPEPAHPTAAAAAAAAPDPVSVHIVEAQILPEPRVAELVVTAPPSPVAVPEQPRTLPMVPNLMDTPIEVNFDLGTLSPSTPQSTPGGSQRGTPDTPSTQRSQPLPQRPLRLFASRPETSPGSEAAASASASAASSPAASAAAAVDPQPRGWAPNYRNPCVIQNTDAVIELSQESLEQLMQQEPERPSSRIQEDLRRVPLTPSSTSRLRTAVQTQLIQTATTSVSSQRTPPQQVPLRPTRHRSTMRKAQEWSLRVAKKWLIIGDSNVAKLPEHDNVHLQIDAFPGATFRNAELLMEKTSCDVTVEKVILSFGINNRVQKTQETAIKQLQRAVNNVKRTFPSADIFVPQVNFSTSLPSKEKLRLTHLNAAIARMLLQERVKDGTISLWAVPLDPSKPEAALNGRPHGGKQAGAEAPGLTYFSFPIAEREAIRLRAKRASIVRELAALRSTKPEPPMVSYLDMGILQPLDVIQEESEEEEEDQDQASPRASRGAGEGKPGSPDPAGLTGPRMTSTPVHGSPRGLAAPCSGCQALTERLLLLERKDFLSSCSFRHTESLYGC